MNLPAGSAIGEFVELKFLPGSWAKGGIPEEGCRLRQSELEKLLEQRGRYEVDDLILGLMDWLDVTDDPEPPLKVLRQLLDRQYPPDGRSSARCRFLNEHDVDRVFHAGPINLAEPLVAWQRRDWIIAMAQRSPEPGRMLVGAPGPISLNTALRMLSLAVVSYMGEPFDSFAGALTSCANTAAFYRSEAGEVTPIGWDDGLDNHAQESMWLTSHDGRWLPPNHVAMQVAIAAGYLN